MLWLLLSLWGCVSSASLPDTRSLFHGALQDRGGLSPAEAAFVVDQWEASVTSDLTRKDEPRLILLKSHKTGSTTIASMLARRAICRAARERRVSAFTEPWRADWGHILQLPLPKEPRWAAAAASWETPARRLTHESLVQHVSVWGSWSSQIEASSGDDRVPLSPEAALWRWLRWAVPGRDARLVLTARDPVARHVSHVLFYRPPDGQHGSGFDSSSASRLLTREAVGKCLAELVACRDGDMQTAELGVTHAETLTRWLRLLLPRVIAALVVDPAGRSRTTLRASATGESTWDEAVALLGIRARLRGADAVDWRHESRGHSIPATGSPVTPGDEVEVESCQPEQRREQGPRRFVRASMPLPSGSAEPAWLRVSCDGWAARWDGRWTPPTPNLDRDASPSLRGWLRDQCNGLDGRYVDVLRAASDHAIAVAQRVSLSDETNPAVVARRLAAARQSLAHGGVPSRLPEDTGWWRRITGDATTAQIQAEPGGPWLPFSEQDLLGMSEVVYSALLRDLTRGDAVTSGLARVCDSLDAHLARAWHDNTMT